MEQALAERRKTLKLINVPYIDQTEKYPTGCESVSAVMLLKYLGYPIEAEEFIDRYLTKRDLEYRQGRLFGPHPDDAFVGSPYNSEDGSYGCYAPCIAAAVRRVVGARFQVTVEQGQTMETLCRKYIDRGMPVILWATLNMEPASLGNVWNLADRAGQFQWVNHQHCLLLVGYDREKYYFNDPWQNAGCIGYDRGLASQRYHEMASQAVGLAESVQSLGE